MIGSQNSNWPAELDFDYMFKLMIIGNSGVGKTSFLVRYVENSFSPNFISTVGIEFKVKTVMHRTKRIRLQIWDTAGQERYRTITTAYYRGALGFILMFDVTNGESFNAVSNWSSQISTYSWDNAQVILVGNKCELTKDRIIPFERGKKLADELGFEYFEISAKENININEVFECLVSSIFHKMFDELEEHSANKQHIVHLNDTPRSHKSSCSC